MTDFKHICQQELNNDIYIPLSSILKNSDEKNDERVFEIILRILTHNHKLHHSRSSYVNYFKNRIFIEQKKLLDSLNYLSLIASLNEGIIHDIDNRLDSHNVNILDSCFLEAYSPILIQKALNIFTKKVKKAPLISDFFLKKLSSVMIEELFNFLNQINQVPYIETRIIEGKSNKIDEDLLQILKLRIRQSTISAFIIFYPTLMLKKLDTKLYKNIIIYFSAIQTIDGIFKDLSEIKSDKHLGRFNAWAILENYDKQFKKNYVNKIKQILEPLNLFTPDSYPMLEDYLIYFIKKKEELLEIIKNI